jgi:uncharacterized membrane protein
MGYDGDSGEDCGDARPVRRVHGGQLPSAGDAGAVEREAGVSGTANGSRGEADANVLNIAATEMFSGPVASPRVLAEYERLVPGAAERMIGCHLRSEAVAADAVERLSRAEAVAVLTGVIGAQVLTVGALIAGAILISAGHTVGALAAIVPGVLGAASQVVAAARRVA